MSLCTHKKRCTKRDVCNLIIHSYCTAIQAVKKSLHVPPDSFPVQDIAPESSNTWAALSTLTYRARLHSPLSQAFKFQINLPTLATTWSSCKSQLHHKLMRNLIRSVLKVQSQWQCSPFISTEHKGSFSGIHFASGPASSSLSSPGYSCSFPAAR